MTSFTSPNTNRTGLAQAPSLAQELIEGAREFPPGSRGPADGLARVRASYAEEAEPIGSVPPPATLGATARTTVKRALGDEMRVLVDKLGERLAFERSGARLYESLLSKLDVHDGWKGGPSRRELLEIRDDERRHFLLVHRAIEEFGGDPSAVTPSANLHGVASEGLCKVLADPRTDVRECLEALLVAELVDNDAWEMLIDLAKALGQHELASRFEEPLRQEQEHLRDVRAWLAAGVSRAATGEVAPPFLTREEKRRARTDGATRETASGARKRGSSSLRRRIKTRSRTKAGSSKSGRSGASRSGANARRGGSARGRARASASRSAARKRR